MGSAARDLRSPPADDAVTAANLADAALLTAAARGQAGSVAALYDKYRDGALAVALSVTADEMEAEDVVQEVFEALPRMARSYHIERGQPPQWLFRSVRNRAIDHVRRRTRQAAHMVAPSAENEALLAIGAGRAPSPVEEAEAEEMLDLIRALEPKYAHLVRLAFVDGWSHSAIAGMTGLPLGTVKTRIRMSLQLIRARMADVDVTPIRIAATPGTSAGIYVIGEDARLVRAARRSVGDLLPVVRLPRLPREPLEKPEAILLGARSRSRAEELLGRIDEMGWSDVPVTVVGPATLARAGAERSGMVVRAVEGQAGMPIEMALAASLCASRRADVRDEATRRLLASDTLPVLLLDRLGRVVRTSRGAVGLFGLTLRQIRHRYVTDLTAMPNGWTELQWHRLVTRGWWSDESVIRRGDGTTRAVHAVGWMGAGPDVFAVLQPSTSRGASTRGG